MTFIEAIPHLLAGKPIHRQSPFRNFPPSKYLYLCGEEVIGQSEKLRRAVEIGIVLTKDDLTADDWQVVNEQPDVDDEGDFSKEYRSRCSCRYCECLNEVPDMGDVCDMCRNGGHQG